MMRWLTVGMAGILCATFAATPLAAQERYTLCAAETRIVHELAPRLVLNDFDGSSQTVAGTGYAFSRCLGNSRHRLRLEASYDHVEERVFRADAGIIAAGVEFHPLPAAPEFAVVPMLRVGQERFRGGLHNTVFGASVIVAHGVALGPAEPGDGPDFRGRILFDFRADYTDRRSSDGMIVSNTEAQATFYGSIGLDQRVGQSRWRWTGRVGYQTLGSGPLDGFGQVLLSVRRMNEDYSDYPWNLQVGFNLGDQGYRAVLFVFSLRFSRS
jgi:hypothetical protein